MDKIVGRNPVLEAIRAGRNFEKLVVQQNAGGSIQKILDQAGERHIPVQHVDKSALDRLAGNGGHQGVLAFVSDFCYAQIEDMLAAARDKNEDPLILVLDGMEDPHNLGAILRSAEGAGVHGVIIPLRRSVGITDVVAKTSSGAIEHIPVAREPNIREALKKLQNAGLWAAALDMDGERYFEKDLTGGLALVIGGEGGGLRRLVKETCDFAVSIPMYGRLASLNASAAAAVTLYEIKRQRIMQTRG
ncbi:MAG: 23S rRNA (guanosine(2251)-2'-O)-methyltransferase RlmB [Clostridiales Family XIII bacterium]|nr:23S rRNA (guanosine(2251)-2'-O)-methyltransferase RlmB [Clostridiales Family XIII bacterium]